MTFRVVVKEVALSQGIHASFMPKPFTEWPGSAMHTHMSLFEGDNNAFYDASAEHHPLQGRSLLHRRTAPARGRDHRAVTNQWVNSYKRLAGGGEAPALHLLGPQQPLRTGPGADVQAQQGFVGPGRAALRSTPPPIPIWLSP